MNYILDDIKTRLDIDILNIETFKDGTTDSLVFSVNNKYLVKTMNEEDIKIQKIFYDLYKDSSYFQKIIYISNKYNYICYKYINGIKFKKNSYDSKKIIDEIYNITKNYKEYNSDFYGYLNYKVKTGYEFLKSEIDYAYDKIKELNIDNNKVYVALENLKDYKFLKYLLHGDFGVHNFLIENNKLKIIDSMPLVFDPLYDFYFACLSSNFIFNNLNLLFKYYDRDINYKKNLFLIVFYIRMSRAYMYDKDNFIDYLKIYINL